MSRRKGIPVVIRWTLQRKLNSVLILCGLVFIGVSAPLISYFSFEAYKAGALEQQARLVGAVRTSAAIATFVANETIAHDVLAGLLQDDEILAAEIRGTDGFVQRADSKEAERVSPGSLTEKRYPLYSPVDESTQVGTLTVWSNDPLIARRARAGVWRNIGLLAGLVMVLSLASVWAANRLAGRPLRELAEQVSRASPEAPGEIRVSRTHRHDEIGLLAESVNRFLQSAHQALTQERTLRERVEKMSRHFNRMFRHSRVGVLVLDSQGMVLHHNPVVFERLIRLGNGEPEDIEAVADLFGAAFASPAEAWQLVSRARHTGLSAEADLALRAAWSEPCWVHLIVSVAHDEEYDDEVIECVMYDVTERFRETEEALRLAETDPLTGILNRRGFEVHCLNCLSQPDMRDQCVVMLIDLDGFKPVNDQYGHAAGDTALRVVAERLRTHTRSDSDLVARLGGDEFVLGLRVPDGDRERVRRIAHKILDAIRAPVTLEDGTQVRLGASIGVAFGREHDSCEAMIAAADAAMYDVKMHGKNGVAFAGHPEGQKGAEHTHG